MPEMGESLSVRNRILDASLKVIRAQGYSGTSIDDLCSAAGVTKGAFFHYFDSKEDLGVSAAQYWSEITSSFFEKAPYRKLKDPLDRLFGYVDFRKAIIQGKLPEFTCLVGTMVQETFDSAPAIREACGKCISEHVEILRKDIQAAKELYVPNAKWTAESLAQFTQTVIQGAFIMAKAKNHAEVAADSIDHLRSYLEFSFERRKNAS